MYTRRAVLSGHTQKPHAMAVSADGRLLVSTSDDKTVRLWDTTSWSLSRTIDDMDPGTRQPIMIFDVSPGGQFVATGTPDFTTKVYAAQTGERIKRLHPVKRDFYNSAEQIRFSPSGDLLACAKGKTIELFQCGDFSKVGELKGHTSKAHLIDWSLDGQMLISCGGKYIKLWDVASLTEVASLTKHNQTLSALAVAPNGKFFATGGKDSKACLWSLPDARELGEYSGHAKYVFDLAISPDGQTVASWDLDENLHLWHTASCAEIARLPRIWGRSLFLPNASLLIFFGERVETLLINPANGDIVQKIPPSAGVAVAPDGTWFAAFDGNDIAIWS